MKNPQVAAALGVNRSTLSEAVNERRGISSEMAVGLPKHWATVPSRLAVAGFTQMLAFARCEGNRIFHCVSFDLTDDTS